MWLLLCLALPKILLAQSVTATVPVGDSPQAVAVNPVTNKIYVANYASDNARIMTLSPVR